MSTIQSNPVSFQSSKGINIVNQKLNTTSIFTYKKVDEVRRIGTDELFAAIQFRDSDNNYHYWYYASEVDRDIDFDNVESILQEAGGEGDSLTPEFFEEKFNGLSIDLGLPNSGSWFSFPFSIAQFSIQVEEVFNINATFPDFQIANLSDLVKMLNCYQSLFIFVNLGETKLGIQSKTAPVSQMTKLTILDSSLNTVEYSAPFSLEVTDASILDEMLSTLRQIRGSNNTKGGLISNKGSLIASVTGQLLVSANKYRKKLVLTNHSPYPMFLAEGNSPTITLDNYNYRVEPDGIFVSDDIVDNVQVIWEIPDGVIPVAPQQVNILEKF